MESTDEWELLVFRRAIREIQVLKFKGHRTLKMHGENNFRLDFTDRRITPENCTGVMFLEAQTPVTVTSAYNVFVSCKVGLFVASVSIIRTPEHRFRDWARLNRNVGEVIQSLVLRRMFADHAMNERMCGLWLLGEAAARPAE